MADTFVQDMETTGPLSGPTSMFPAERKRRPPELRRKVPLETTAEILPDSEGTSLSTSDRAIYKRSKHRSLSSQCETDHEYEHEHRSSSGSPSSPEDNGPGQQAVVFDYECDAPNRAVQIHDSYERRVDGSGDTCDDQELVQDVSTKAVGVVGDTVGAVGGTAGNLVGSTLAMSSATREASQGDEQLRLRLDLNLDFEIQLKAKIHGDLTLQLLYDLPCFSWFVLFVVKGCWHF